MRDEHGQRVDVAVANDKYGAPGQHRPSNHPAQYSKRTERAMRLLDQTKINNELIENLIEYIHGQMVEDSDANAILVFMPGVGEIKELMSQLNSNRRFNRGYLVLALHSGSNAQEQAKAFANPGKGVTKVIVATNVAETSITIDDIAYVIDTGRVKENRFILSTRTTALVETWVSQASAKQRRGRAGRVRAGTAFHLYSRPTYEEDMAPYTLPEILRSPLTEICLQLKMAGGSAALDADPEVIFQKMIDPPKPKAVATALEILFEVKAIDPQTRELTPLGHHLAQLPVDVRVGKMILYGAIFKCLDPILTIAASMSTGAGPFYSPMMKRDEAKEAKSRMLRDESDHLTIVGAFDDWKHIVAALPPSYHARPNSHPSESQWCRRNFVNGMVMRRIVSTKQRLASLLVNVGFVSRSYEVEPWFEGGGGGGRWRGGGGKGGGSGGEDLSRGGLYSLNPEDVESDNVPLIKGVLCGGLYPNVVKATVQSSGYMSLYVAPDTKRKEDRVVLHPSSALHGLKKLDHGFLVYQEQLRTRNLYVCNVSTVSAMAVLLFGGNLEVFHSDNKVVVDRWIYLDIVAKTGVMLKKLRDEIESVMRAKIRNPNANAAQQGEADAAHLEQQARLLDSVKQLLVRGESRDVV